MKTALFISMALLLLPKFHYAQNINMVIQVNETLIYSELTDMFLQFDFTKGQEKIQVAYVPGDLIMNEEAWNLINSDTSAKMSLHFDYNTFQKNHHEIAHFYVTLSRTHLEQPYLIVNIYDFKSRKYKRWYRSHTDNDFLAELVFPNSGMYIRKK